MPCERLLRMTKEKSYEIDTYGMDDGEPRRQRGLVTALHRCFPLTPQIFLFFLLGRLL
jgi:hypothetical protein